MSLLLLLFFGCFNEVTSDDITLADPPAKGGEDHDLMVEPNPPVPPGTLNEDQAIIRMIQSQMSKQLPGLKACHEAAARIDPDVGGSWELLFTVGESGEVKDLEVRPVSSANQTIESCIKAKVAYWKFDPIKVDLPIKKTVTFGEPPSPENIQGNTPAPIIIRGKQKSR